MAQQAITVFSKTDHVQSLDYHSILITHVLAGIAVLKGKEEFFPQKIFSKNCSFILLCFCMADTCT